MILGEDNRTIWRNIAALGPYGITAATLSALQTRISAYVAVIGAPRVARAKISTATEMLGAEFARADMILNFRSPTF